MNTEDEWVEGVRSQNTQPSKPPTPLDLLSRQHPSTFPLFAFPTPSFPLCTACRLDNSLTFLQLRFRHGDPRTGDKGVP